MLPTNPLLNATAPAGPHLPTATLRQYAAGTLSPAAQHRVEAHTLACPRCADILAGLLQTTPATTDQALAQLQQRLRHRTQQQAPAALPLTRTRHQHRWMVLQLAAAAALLFGLVAGGWWTWQQRHPALPTAAQPATPRAVATPAASIAEAPAASATALKAPPASSVAGAAVAARVARPVAAHRAVAPHRVGRASVRRAAPIPQADLVAVSRAAAPLPLPISAPDTLPKSVAASAPAAPSMPAASQARTHDSNTTLGLMGRAAGVAVHSTAVAAPPARVRLDAMPAAPGIPPTPVGGYTTWREKIRHEAAEFKPEAPDTPLSGSVQLRVTVGADGKVQEIKVLHGLRADYDAEAQRLVCDGPNWIPGIGSGKRAAQTVEVTVPFQ